MKSKTLGCIVAAGLLVQPCVYSMHGADTGTGQPTTESASVGKRPTRPEAACESTKKDRCPASERMAVALLLYAAASDPANVWAKDYPGPISDLRDCALHALRSSGIPSAKARLILKAVGSPLERPAAREDTKGQSSDATQAKDDFADLQPPTAKAPQPPKGPEHERTTTTRGGGRLADEDLKPANPDEHRDIPTEGISPTGGPTPNAALTETAASPDAPAVGTPSPVPPSMRVPILQLASATSNADEASGVSPGHVVKDEPGSTDIRSISRKVVQEWQALPPGERHKRVHQARTQLDRSIAELSETDARKVRAALDRLERHPESIAVRR